MKNILDVSEPGEYSAGQKVELIIHSQTDLGVKAIVNQKHWGLLFQQEIFQNLEAGQKIEGYIKRVRDDGKLDLILYQVGNKDALEISEKILQMLKNAGGFLAITDKTDPEEIYYKFGVSKKKYKIALGGLYKRRLIRIETDGIYLTKS